MGLRADPGETSSQRGFKLSAIVLGIGELTNASIEPSLASRFSTFRKTCHFLAWSEDAETALLHASHRTVMDKASGND